MPDFLTGGLVASGVGSVVSGVMGSNASEDASEAQTQAAQESNALQKYMYEQNMAKVGTQMGNIQPYYDTGTNALNTLSGIMRGTTPWNATPGYNFRLSEGNKLLERRASAMGNVLGGAQLKAIDRYGQDYASNEYQNVLKNWNTLAGYGQNAYQGQNNLLSAAMGAGQNYANAVSSNNQYGANAQASGAINSANALTGGISSGINNMNTWNYLNQNPRGSTYGSNSYSSPYDPNAFQNAPSNYFSRMV